MQKHLGILLVLMLGFGSQARAAYGVTDLTYTVGAHTLSGYSGTYLDYYEANPYWQCIFTGWAYFPGFGEQGVEVCTDGIVEYPHAEVVAAEHSPYGQVSSRYGYGVPNAAVGFPNFSNPWGGIWYAYADHYIQLERQWCSMTPVYNNGYFSYYPEGCAPMSNLGVFMGASNDEVSIPGPPSCSDLLDAKAIELATSWPVRPYERAASFYCDYGVVQVTGENDSFRIVSNYGDHPYDPCMSSTKLMDESGLPWGNIHTHPLFTSVAEYMEGEFGCNNFKGRYPGIIPTLAWVLYTHNPSGENWSETDRNIWICRTASGYLRANNGVVKKLVGSPECNFVIDRNIP